MKKPTTMVLAEQTMDDMPIPAKCRDFFGACAKPCDEIIWREIQLRILSTSVIQYTGGNDA